MGMGSEGNPVSEGNCVDNTKDAPSCRDFEKYNKPE